MAVLKDTKSGKKKISTAMPCMADEVESSAQRTKKLKLDEEGYKPSKTRVEMYKELEKEEKKLDEDIYIYANPVIRGCAFAIDLGFMYFLYKIAFFFTKPIMLLIQLFLDRYHLQLLINQDIFLKLVLLFSTITVAFIGVLIPLAFFNTSFGKRVFGLRVRGDHSYTLTLGLALEREFIFKPISIGLIVGFIFPFFNKERKSLHDKFSKTFVIKD